MGDFAPVLKPVTVAPRVGSPMATLVNNSGGKTLADIRSLRHVGVFSWTFLTLGGVLLL